jgi:Trk K+ transport system NAD-binding subunit/nucleotide-binding universal stress UspA family protein
MKVIVVGAGGATRELLRGLGEIWDVTVVDTDPERLDQARRVRAIETVLGDGSSRVVLEQAGLSEADALVALTNDDSVNLEASRLAVETGLFRVVAVAADPERLSSYRDLDVPVLSPDRLIARRIEINLEPRRVSSAPFADGMAEAIEFRVSEDSTVRGRRLRDLHSESWLIAAVLRDGNLIVPHGGTVLQAGDLVTVVGAAADYPTIVRTFTSGEASFPTDFGKQVAVSVETATDVTGPVAEAIHLTRNSAAEALLVVHRDTASAGDGERARVIEKLLEQIAEMADGLDLRMRPVDGTPYRALLSPTLSEGVGLLVLPSPAGDAFRGRFRTVRLFQRLAALGLPALLSDGSQPYQRVVVPARDTPAGHAAARAAVDLASYAKSVLVAVAVVPPAFIVGTDAREEARSAVALLREQAAVQDVAVKRHIRQGNPVRGIEETLKEHDLLVLGMARARPTILTPGISGHLVRRASVSVLVVPSEG